LKPIPRVFAVILAIAAPAAASAEVPSVPYNWSNVVIGGGGFSPNIVFSPAEKGLAYLRTDVGGVYRWDAQQQRWLPLEDSQWQDSYFGIESVAPDPRDPNVVYLAAGMYYGDVTVWNLFSRLSAFVPWIDAVMVAAERDDQEKLLEDRPR